MGNDYLSLDNLKEIAEIDSHIKIAESLINKYQWPDDVHEELGKKLQRIISKEKDKSLNLSVIGEFTTGKSTFINAFIRNNLLVSSIMQGTTLANTIIDFCPSYAICLHHVNGKKAVKEFPDIDELKKSIASVTTNNRIARVLQAVRIGLPSPNLRSGVRIIDTPGTNATEKWHEEVTKNALKDISDLSIVLVDATKPLPETLLDFIEVHLKGVLHQCAFVVTKLDLIAKNERRMMLTYIQKKLESFLERDDIVVFPYVAPLVINSFAPATFDMEDEALLNLSMKSERAIIEYMGRQKIKAQTQKLLFFLNDLFVLISEKIEAVKSHYDTKLAMLEKSRQIDLTSFVRNQKSKCTESYISSVRKIKPDIVDSFYGMAEAAVELIIENIASVDTLDGFSKYINDGIIPDCQQAAEVILNSEKNLLNKPKDLFFRALQYFQRDFENNFKDLKILNVTFNATSAVPAPPSINTADLSIVKDYIKEQVTRDNKAFGVGALGGAAIGTAICPGIGTAIGFVAGLFTAGAIAPETETVKAALIEKIRTPLTSYFNSVAGDLERTFDAYVNVLENQIAVEIDRYEIQYKRDVENKINEQLKKKSEVQKRMNALDSDCHEIAVRRKKLNDISVKITSLKNDI